MPNFSRPAELQTWFQEHVTLAGAPYTLDLDQAQAVLDIHKNTLVTARAGSGKTRVIVAKIAYLISQDLADFHQIAAFMFNRTAAAEVNERIGAVAIDGVKLNHWHGREQKITIASTFHKFALDTVKLTGEHPQLISETEHDALIRQSVRQIFAEQNRHVSHPEYEETLKLISSFIARAGQKYSGSQGLSELCHDVQQYISVHRQDSAFRNHIRLHEFALSAYEAYLLALIFPKLDFNILMSRAAQVLAEPSHLFNPAQRRVAAFKYILVDEYQDFSQLFFNLIQAIRQNCPDAHLFAVGDDWQAINRFAGSDVNYFINFAEYFPEDVTNIPLVTNYRSSRRIVENANQYMLKHYDRHACKAKAFSKKNGKIYRLNPVKTKFDTTDLQEDALGDARFQQALATVCGGAPSKYQAPAQLLKTVFKIVKKHRKSPILLLHRHNFTSFPGVTLADFVAALKICLAEQYIIPAATFDQQIRAMTMHKSKGLESEIVILLEVNRDQVLSSHPHATIFELFGDTLAAEKADQHRLLYVALTRAKHKLYILSSDPHDPLK